MTEGLNFSTCVSQLQAIGLRKGDAVLVRTALGALGPLNDRRSKADFLIDALLDVVGTEGLLVGLAFSKNDWSFSLSKLPPYDPREPANTGGFVAAMLKRRDATRSAHPTNSFVAIGKNATEFLAGHDAAATCFAPMAKLLSRRGKMILIGCEETSPGFSTVHLAQNALGLDTRTWLSLIFGRRYIADDGGKRWYRKKDIPGCSIGFSKFYEAYRAHGALAEDKIGAANSMLIECRTAYDIEYEIVARDPNAALCDRDFCTICRIGWFYKPLELRRYLGSRLRNAL